jgi:peroxiredoxin
MQRASVAPVLSGAAAVLLGAPAYLALARYGSAPAWLLDRPWPLAAIVGALLAFCVRLTLRASGDRARRVALGATFSALASLAALLLVSRRPMPAPSPEVALGRPLPDVALTDDMGQAVSLPSLRGHPAVLVFYRGALCVACRAQLAALAEYAGPFIAAGVRVFGISADPPSLSAEWKKTLSLPFSLLTDDHQGIAQTLCSARAHCLLVVDAEGVVRWGALNDYWRGAEPATAVLLAAYRSSER